ANTEGFGRVVPAVIDVDSPFDRIEVGVVCAFTGHERVQPCSDRLADTASAAARDHADLPDDLGSSRHHVDARAEYLVQPRRERLPPDLALAPHSDIDPLVRTERTLQLDAQRAGQLGVAADLWMHVEREMRGVQRDPTGQQRLQPTVAATGNGSVSVPEE